MEQQAFGVTREDRAAIVRRGAAALRRLWTEDVGRPRRPALPLRGRVDRHAARSSSRSTCGSAATRRPSCAGSAGSATAGSRASARPAMVAEGRVIVEKAAADAGRAIDPEHFGAMVFYTRTEMPERVRAADREAPRRRSRRGHPGRARRAPRRASRSSSPSASRSWCPSRSSRSSLGRRARHARRRGPRPPELSRDPYATGVKVARLSAYLTPVRW